jgi:3-hydroxyacyl-[acyl-carrier-protein] dehydratase
MELDILEISRVLPHRYPFLLVDRILEFESGKRIVGLKNITMNEPQFTGHFPGKPIMPGVLILEALAQVSAVLVLRDRGVEGKVPLFAGLDEVRFRRQVVPGDQLRLEAEVVKLRGAFGHMRGRALVGADLAAEGLIKFMIPAPDTKGDDGDGVRG